MKMSKYIQTQPAIRLKPYRKEYKLKEAADHCLISISDIQDIAVQGEISLHVWLPLMMIEKSSRIKDGNRILLETQEYAHEGYLPLYPSDVRKLIKYKTVNIRCFPCPKDNDCKIFLKTGTPDVEVFNKDIRVLKDDLIRLQEYVGVRSNEKAKVKVIGRIDDLVSKKNKALIDQRRGKAKTEKTTHDELFQSIRFKGIDFSFGMVQADIIKQLYNAYYDSHPRIHFKTLIKNANSKSEYMRDVYRTQEHWKQLILTDGKGYYWLHEDFFSE